MFDIFRPSVTNCTNSKLIFELIWHNWRLPKQLQFVSLIWPLIQALIKFVVNVAVDNVV